MSVLTPDRFRSACSLPLSGSWPRRCELFPLPSSPRPRLSLVPTQSPWCENYQELALARAARHAVEEHSPGTALAEQAPGALTADPDLRAVASPGYGCLSIRCILGEQRCRQSVRLRLSAALPGPARQPRRWFRLCPASSGLLCSALPPLPPSLLAVVCCSPGCRAEGRHVAFGLQRGSWFVPWDVLRGS